ncbi:gamma-glutamyltransferase [Candidimonas nitroreducens]|uniref:Glutathione hydrolase proenzyme n=1 Tax=Candidimonas nitroreducens TaxID=683354 RepID=A0A225MRM8_9BURK|nr:gamma-glutamyltransferase [Candidimonas nitroreducens]OWT62131.1 gamma-glutamyltransferase [Candidimonas nitroreducens]
MAAADALPAVLQQAMAAEDINPEAGTGRIERPVAHARHDMVSSANPLASRAGLQILRQGGSAADAAIAMQMVLNLVEPQSSGIGGGAFIVTYDARQRRVRSYDGRETAPAAARSDRFMRDGHAMPFMAAVNSGLSVGTPGVLRALALMHAREGHLPWKTLFQPAIRLAEQGFKVSPRLHALLEQNQALRKQPAAAAYFYNAQGQAWPVGYRLRNPALAQVLRGIAERGPDAFYKGEVARDIVAAIAHHAVPGDMTLADLSGYRALERAPLCAPYRSAYTLCGPPPPSSGPLTVIQMLEILTHTPIDRYPVDSVQAVHYFAEAGKLAYADRDLYVADPAFVKVPVKDLLSPGYLALRATLIEPGRSMGPALPGDPARMRMLRGAGNTPEIPSTSHLVVVDDHANVVSMTTTIESAFGSKIFVDGFLLNNQLTDFSLSDVDAQGRPVANRVEPLKRPRSSMAPMLILKHDKPYMAIGSPGGSAIINYVAKAVRGVLDRGLNIQEAIDLPNLGSRNRGLEIEKYTALHRLIPGLRAMGYTVHERDFPSGLQGVVITPQGLEGGADPRREGLAIGD